LILASKGATGWGFRGWRVVGAAAGLQFLQSALMHQAFGAYVAMLSSEKGWSKTALSGAAAMQSVESALLGPVIGWMADKFGARGMVRAGVLVFGLGLVAFSFVQTLAAFYGAILLIAFGTSFGGYFPLTVAIVHWFERQRARALSSMSFGLALGGTVVPLVAWAMQTWGWRATALGSGILVILVGFPLASMVYGKPEDCGETVDGVPEAAARPAADPAALAASSAAVITEPAAPREFTAREALRTQAFWLIGLGHAFALLVVTAVNVHAITHMKESLGYSVAQASIVITIMTVAQGGGVLLGWLIGDRYDKRFVAASTMLMHCTGLLLLTYASGAAMLGAFALIHGVAWGLRGPFMQAIRADYFGRHAIGMILGLSTILLAIGQVGGPMLAGALADATGDYRVGFTLIGVMAGLGALFFLLARRPA
jgi:sugar phosphate permease